MKCTTALRSLITPQFLSRRRSALAAALLFFSAALPASASITYTLVNYPAGQNGWNLTGSITTDGTFGQITQLNILSWSYQYSQVGGPTYSGSSAGVEYPAELFAWPPGFLAPFSGDICALGVLVLPSAWDYPTDPYPDEEVAFSLLQWMPGILSVTITTEEWEELGSPPPPGPPYNPETWEWVTESTATTNYNIVPIVGQFVIATSSAPIPEPTTLIIWSLLGAASWLRIRVVRRGRRVSRRLAQGK